MPLLDLPVELLVRIFHFVGPEPLKQDLGRLTISKAWNTFALIELHSHVTLDLKHILRLSHAQKYGTDNRDSGVPVGAMSTIRRLKVSIEEQVCGFHATADRVLSREDLEEDEAEALFDDLSGHAALFEAVEHSPQHRLVHALGRPEMGPVFGLLERLQRLRSLEIHLDLGWSWEEDGTPIPPCAHSANAVVDHLCKLHLPALRALYLNFPSTPPLASPSHRTNPTPTAHADVSPPS